MGRRPLQHGVSFVPVSAHWYYSAGGDGGGLLPVGRLWAGSFKPVLREEKGGGETRGGGHFIEILCVGRM